MADVFISYARATAQTARAIAAGLRGRGYSVWIDDDLPAHRDFPSVIEENLRAAKAVLVVWSDDARRSRWVPAEADLAHKLGTLVQLSLDGVTPPLPFNRMQCVNLPGWRGDFADLGWSKVEAGIAQLTARAAPAANIAAVAPLPPRSSERLLAVLPFDNLAADPELEYLSDGIAEEVQQTVAQGSTLKVLARSSTFQFRGADKSARKVAAELRATHMLDGSLRRSGSRVRITAHLIQCADETTLWSHRFDGDLADLFELQERIAVAVADALKVTLSVQSPAAPLDPSVYEQFLRARAVISEGNRFLDDAAAQAAPLLTEVTLAAPDFAPAWELLAGARAWTLRSGRRTCSYAEGRTAVVEAADKALALDPRRGGAYAALAMLEPWGAYAERERLLNKALEASPSDPMLLTEMSTFCWSVGRFREALRLAEQASELNPLMPAARLNVAEMRLYVGDYEVSIRMLEELNRRWPRNFEIMVALVDFSAGVGFWDAFDRAAPGAALFEGAEAETLRARIAWGHTRRTEDAHGRAAALRAVSAILDRTGRLGLDYVEAISLLGLVDEAFGLAERASFDHMFDPDGPLPGGGYPGCMLGHWSGLNKTPRFIELCERLGLCDYWVKSGAWPDCADWTPYDFKALVRRSVASHA